MSIAILGDGSFDLPFECRKSRLFWSVERDEVACRGSGRAFPQMNPVPLASCGTTHLRKVMRMQPLYNVLIEVDEAQ